MQAIYIRAWTYGSRAFFQKKLKTGFKKLQKIEMKILDVGNN
jgi:hypothetical protein